MFVVTVDGTAKHQLQHSAELTLVTSLRCNSQQLQQPNTDQRRMDIGKLRSMEDTTP